MNQPYSPWDNQPQQHAGYQPQYYPPPGQYPQQPPRRKSWARRHWFLTFITFPVAGLLLIVVIAAAASSGSSGSTPVASSGAPAAAPSAATRPSTPAAPSSPSMTVGEQQAVDGAQQYLAMGSGFSYNSLLNQLTSSDGDGDTAADAEFAIKHLNPDWDAQAVDAAKGYLQMGGFSRASLIDQLTSSDGDGFTEAQAEYAADKVGL